MKTTSGTNGSGKLITVNAPSMPACAPTLNGSTCRVTLDSPASSLRWSIWARMTSRPPSQAELHPALDLLGLRLQIQANGAKDRSRVVRDLEDTGDERFRVHVDRFGVGLQLAQSLVRKVLELGVQPAFLPGLAGNLLELVEPLAGDAVDLQHVADVARCRSDACGLDTGDLGAGALQPGCHVLDRQTSNVPQLP